MYINRTDKKRHIFCQYLPFSAANNMHITIRHIEDKKNVFTVQMQSKLMFNLKSRIFK